MSSKIFRFKDGLATLKATLNPRNAEAIDNYYLLNNNEERYAESWNQFKESRREMVEYIFKTPVHFRGLYKLGKMLRLNKLSLNKRASLLRENIIRSESLSDLSREILGSIK